MFIAALVAAGQVTAGSAVCSRPDLPFQIDEAVWQALEGSEFYRTLPPAPAGPRFCPLAETGNYGLVGPCNFVPPFVWWLERRLASKA